MKLYILRTSKSESLGGDNEYLKAKEEDQTISRGWGFKWMNKTPCHGVGQAKFIMML